MAVPGPVPAPFHRLEERPGIPHLAGTPLRPARNVEAAQYTQIDTAIKDVDASPHSDLDRDDEVVITQDPSKGRQDRAQR